MSTINDGGPAFPSHGSMGEVVHDGMTLRDYFAAKAMQAYLSDPMTSRELGDYVARISYAHADAMLAAREVTP